MPDHLKITRAAARAYFAAPRVILADPKSAALLADEMVQGITLFCVEEAGVVSLPGEKSDDLLPLTTAPAQIVGCFFHKASDTLEKRLSHYIDQTGGHKKPQMVFSAKAVKKENCQAFIRSVLARMLADQNQRLASSSAEIVALRHENERLRGKLMSVRQLFSVNQMSTDHIIVALNPSQAHICPDIGQENTSVEMVLPSYANRLTAVDLYVPEVPADGFTEGEFTLEICTAINTQLIAQTRKNYEDIQPGWNRFSLVTQPGVQMGDMIARIEWRHTGTGAVPRLALSTVTGKDFGISESRDTLAIRLLRSVASIYEKNPVTVQPRATTVLPQDFEAQTRLFAYPSTPETACEKLGGNPLSYGDFGLQTHPVQGGTVGAIMQLTLPKGCSGLRILCQTDHGSGPDVDYIAAIVGDGKNTMTDAEIGAHITGEYDGTWAAAHTVSPQDGAIQLSLTLPDGHTGQTCSLLLAVKPVSDSVSYGWCRWKEIDCVRTPATRLARYHLPAVTAAQPSTVDADIAVLNFADAADSFTFIDGAGTAARILQEQGLEPLSFNGEHSYLQTHALRDRISAGVMAAGIPHGAREIHADVEICHPLAGPQRYFMAVIGRSVDVRTFLGTVQDDTYVDAAGNCCFMFDVAAETPTTLSAQLPENLPDDNRLVLGIMPSKSAAAYGWCRWTGMKFILPAIPRI